MRRTTYLTRKFQKSSTVFPQPDTTPMPVTTTRLLGSEDIDRAVEACDKTLARTESGTGCRKAPEGCSNARRRRPTAREQEETLILRTDDDGPALTDRCHRRGGGQ